MLALHRFTPGNSIPFHLLMEEDEVGVPIAGLGGYDFWFTAKADPSVPDAQALVRMSTVVNDARDGVMERDGLNLWWVVPRAVSLTLTASIIYFDLQVRTADGRIDTLRRGQLKPEPRITFSP